MHAVGVGIDAAFDTLLLGELPPAPVHVETPGAGVELDDGAGLGGGIDHSGNVDIVSRALEQQTAGEMAEHGDVRILDGADDALCHLGLGQIEDVVNGGDDVVELRHDFVAEVEAAVFEDVHLTAGEDAEAFLLHLLV